VAEPSEVRVLGPVEAIGRAGPAALHGARQRTILGLLALHAGTVVPITRLVDALWGDDPPRTAVKTLHSHVARIRQALGACGFPPVLETVGQGYALALAPDSVDAQRFIRQVREAGNNPRRAVETLRAALELWRGEAFTGAELTGWAVREADRLHELRLSAQEDLWDAELRLGRHDEAVRELPRLLSQHPMRERLVGLHMLALYRCGRHTEALAAFQQLRRRLADELGVDPGPDLDALHTAILRRDAALDRAASTAKVPAQLPARVGHFTGREAELEALDHVLDAVEAPVVVISGAAGMGKTALGVQWAHRAADRFPDGQLFLDLRGHDPAGAVPVADALAHLLRGLEIPDERIPGSDGERAALYRSLLHGKRCLILADNAGSVPGVLPLVPGGGGSLLVVTSRMTLAALGTRHAVHHVTVDALGHEASMTLLGKVLGEGRVRRERGPAARLARLCGGMPLALRIAAARLVGDPDRPIARAAAELVGGNRLDSLEVDGDTPTVRSVLASAYLPLGAAQTRMFNLLGLGPGNTFSTWLGAAMCGLPVAEARPAVAELGAAHLITEVAGDRYRFHDLIREFARRCARTDEPAAGQVEARERLVDWYLHIAAAANKVIDPSRDRVMPTLRHPAPEVPFAPDRQEALAFLEAERDNLLPVVRHARDSGWLVAAWQLTYLLTSFYDTTGHWHERVELCRLGTLAATELGDPLAEAEMLRALGVAYFMTQRLLDALDTNASALRAVRAAGDLGGEGHVHNNMANAYAQLRRFDEAITAHSAALACHTKADNTLGRALSQRNLGHTYVQMGRAAQSLEPLADALATFRKLGIDRLEVATLQSIGEAHLQLGDHQFALAHFGDALAVSRSIGDRWWEWETLLGVGQANLGSGNVAAALENFGQALDIARQVGDRHGEASALGHLGRALLAAGDLAAARERLELGRSVRARVPDPYEEAHLHRDLADLEARCGNPAAAGTHRHRAAELYRQANATAEADAVAGPA
jgi:DNA-binding SARP family transcriptional activator